ncbi:MAG: (d)CMP kinase [Rhodospirillales bacterium]|nr:(d)CMP kinase [Rhodospirillales bacterium]
MTVGQSRVIAIDGPAAAGKGTLARRLAAHLGYAYLDTGALYRAVAARLLACGVKATPAAAAAEARRLRPEDLERDDLRGDDVAGLASMVAAMGAVRAALLSFQREFAARPPDGRCGAVLDGRDIATVVCPDAFVKLFVTAAVEVRAERRLKELRERGVNAIHSRVLREMQERDARDSERSIAPLLPARDAFVIDTSTLDAEHAFAAALEIVEARIFRAHA